MHVMNYWIQFICPATIYIYSSIFESIVYFRLRDLGILFFLWSPFNITFKLSNTTNPSIFLVFSVDTFCYCVKCKLVWLLFHLALVFVSFMELFLISCLDALEAWHVLRGTSHHACIPIISPCFPFYVCLL